MPILESAGEDGAPIAARLLKNFRATDASLMKTLMYTLAYQFTKVFAVCVLMAFLVLLYYLRHCDFKHGRYVSKDMHMPLRTEYTVLNAFMPEFFPIRTESLAFWTYTG
eukprot:TRINITY_DN81542_c0_g1_i1.p1 TRINITY_DN81542_c0_g1~~TRINITY_DN81542_c0_g1_i1.p1  ORF type:complete len:121 (-),score=18.66 TRINITY_DN81542_c0_g1_i1:56-382(-)